MCQVLAMEEQDKSRSERDSLWVFNIIFLRSLRTSEGEMSNQCTIEIHEWFLSFFFYETHLLNQLCEMEVLKTTAKKDMGSLHHFSMFFFFAAQKITGQMMWPSWDRLSTVSLRWPCKKTNWECWLISSLQRREKRKKKKHDSERQR